MSGEDRLRPRRRQLSPGIAGLLVALLASAGLSLTQRDTSPPVAPRAAIRAALQDSGARRALTGSAWNRITANPIDSQLERVSFWKGDRIVGEVAVGPSGRVTAVVDDHRKAVPYGDWIAYQPALLVSLSLLFLAMTAVTPWRRMRNLDALAALSFVVSIVLFQRRYVDASLVIAAPALAYLMVRCACRGLGNAHAAAPSQPLLTALLPRTTVAQRVRWLRVSLVALALVFVMVGVSSPDAVDVAYAVMEGATKLVHGVLPYGHMPPGIIHGDTYPILSYALYCPLALVAPVQSIWYSVDGALGLAVAAALATAWGVFRAAAGPRRPRADTGRGRPPEADEAGLRAGLAVLSFPPLLITASSGTTDVVLAAALAAALVLWRRPAAGSALLTAAGWFKLAPLALLPLLLAPLRGRRLAWGLVAVAAVSALPVAVLLALGGVHGPAAMIHAVSYQFSRGSLQSVWSVLGIEKLQPLVQATVLGLIAAGAVKLWREPQLSHDRARIASLIAAILIGLQLAAEYWAFLYLVWFVPLLCVALFATDRPPARSLARVHPTRASAPRDLLAA